MSVIISKKLSRDKQKVWYTFEWGKQAGQRMAAGVFTYTKPKDQLQKNHNKEAIAILENKKSQMTLDCQSINTSYIPQHKLKTNFLDYYNAFVKANATGNNRHLQNSMAAFKKFLNKDFISPADITENLCEQFRNHLLKTFNGETPSGYFMRFKRVLRGAKKDGYFKESPAEDIAAKTNPNKKVKEILSEDEYIKLMNTPCLNYEVKKAFVVSLYTGLRWIDVKPLKWESVQDEIASIIQNKTGKPLDIPLHSVARQVMGARKSGHVFQLPTQDGANKILNQWCDDAGLNKHITWHCARHSFSVLLQKKGVDLATIAGMLGHTTTKYVQQTYKRYIMNSAKEAIQLLPTGT
jgi:integrase/recombinase XerD